MFHPAPILEIHNVDAILSDELAAEVLAFLDIVDRREACGANIESKKPATLSSKETTR